MSRIIRAALAAAVSTAAVLAPAASYAKAVTEDDAKGDVFKYTYEKGSEEPTFTPSKKNLNVDVDTLVVSHGDKRVQLRFTFFDLAKDGPGQTIYARFKTNEEKEFSFYGGSAKGEDGWITGGYVYDTDELRARTLEARGDVEPPPDPCSTDGGDTVVEIDWKADTLTMSAPRSCFSGPSWINAHVDVLAFVETEGGEGVQLYENPHIKGSNYKKGWTGQIAKG